MKTKATFILSIIAAGLIIISSCEKEGENETKISTATSDDSHNNGQDCMSCHKQGGDGEGWFTAAGSVYNTTGGSVYFYSGINGTGELKKEVEIDKKGNFYTTENFEVSGLYPQVISSNGDTLYMSQSLTGGSCNSCHGSSQAKITF